jgi:hypothetical protein
MYAVASCLASILRGTTTDQFGDQVDTGTVIATDVPALITEKSRTVYDPSTQERRIVRVSRGAVQSDTDIRDNDQLRDYTTGITYMVQSVTQAGGAGFVNDLVLELKRVTGVG